MAGLYAFPNCGAYCMSKSSVIQFSDALRIELNRFGVKVSTILPGGYRSTGFCELCLKSMDRIWNETEERVKSSYGQKCFEGIKNKVINYLSSPLIGNNPQVVINDIIEAIVNYEPNIIYIPIDGMFNKIAFKVFIHFHTKCLIKLFIFSKI